MHHDNKKHFQIFLDCDWIWIDDGISVTWSCPSSSSGLWFDHLHQQELQCWRIWTEPCEKHWTLHHTALQISDGWWWWNNMEERRQLLRVRRFKDTINPPEMIDGHEGTRPHKHHPSWLFLQYGHLFLSCYTMAGCFPHAVNLINRCMKEWPPPTGRKVLKSPGIEVQMLNCWAKRALRHIQEFHTDRDEQ